MKSEPGGPDANISLYFAGKHTYLRGANQTMATFEGHRKKDFPLNSLVHSENLI